MKSAEEAFTDIIFLLHLTFQESSFQQPLSTPTFLWRVSTEWLVHILFIAWDFYEESLIKTLLSEKTYPNTSQGKTFASQLSARSFLSFT